MCTCATNEPLDVALANTTLPDIRHRLLSPYSILEYSGRALLPKYPPRNNNAIGLDVSPRSTENPWLPDYHRVARDGVLWLVNRGAHQIPDDRTVVSTRWKCVALAQGDLNVVGTRAAVNTGLLALL